MLVKELKVLTNKTVREACGYTNLIDRKMFCMQQNNTGKVLDITFNGSLGVLRSAFDIGEEVTGEIKIKDLGFMSLSTAHFMAPTARGKDDTTLAHVAHISLDSDDA